MKGLAVFLALIVPPAVYFPTLGAQREAQQRQASQELAELDRRLEDARAAQQDMTGFQQDVAHLDTDFADSIVTLPPKLGTSSILLALGAAGSRNGVQIVRFAPRPPVESKPLQIVSIEAEADGPPEAVDALVKEIGDRPQPGHRFLTVSGITTSGNRTSFVVTGYALPDGK